jgi:beta-lactamase class A
MEDPMTPCAYLPRTLCLALALTTASLAVHGADWTDALRQHIERIDKATPGQLGVYIKRLDNGETLNYQADRPWYLGSSAKLPIAIAVLQESEAGKLKLSQQVTLQDTDKIDGSGNVVWQKSGTSYGVEALLKRMLMESDNTAANMLVRTIGEDALNHRARFYLGPQGFNRITTFTQVRQDVYGALHPDARKLPNMDLVRLAAVPMGPKRVDALVRMLERLVTGQLVSPPNLQRLFTDLKYETYDAYRLEAGLPRTVRFIHKTGTQLGRACHMGVINPQDGGRAAVIVATCAEDLDEHRDAGRAFEQIGRAITQTLLSDAAKK